MSSLSFTINSYQESSSTALLSVMPMIDGIPLDELVLSYEERMGYIHPLIYAGIPRTELLSQGVHRHFAGFAYDESPSTLKIRLLECECSSLGCFSFFAEIFFTDDTVTWLRFEQPNRPEWDYTGFGPLSFPKPDYEKAIENLAQKISQVASG